MGGGGGNFLGNVVSNPLSAIVNPIGAIANPLQTPAVNKGLQAGKNIMSGQPLSGDQPNINIPGVTPPDYSGDQQQISGLTDQINKLYGNQMSGVQNTYGQQQQAEKAQIDQQTKDMITNLTTGPQGEALREKYNGLGLLNSGAFNQGLADSFAPIQQQAQNDILSQNQQQFGDMRNIMGQQTSTDASLASGGTQRQFSLEDWYNNAMQNRNLAQSGANLTVQSGNQNSQNQLLSSLIGGGATLAAK